MLTWQHPEWLIALVLLIPVWMMYGWYRRRQRQGIEALGSPALLKRMGIQLNGRKQFRSVLLLSLALTSLVLALANPQVGRRYEKVKQRGVDVILALDVSASMLAEDEQPNRLARAKLLIERFLSRLQGDRVGVIVFAGDAYVQVPLTSDYGAATSILRPVSPDAVPRQGTAIGQAIDMGAKAFAGSSDHFRAMFVISDGENHEGQAVEAAAAAREQGLRIHCIGVGTENGSTIPEYVGGTKSGEKRDRNGVTVVTKMNPAMLAGVAEAGGGRFFRLTDIQQTLEAMEEELDQMTEVDFEERFITDFEDQFSWMLALALLFLALEAFSRMYSSDQQA